MAEIAGWFTMNGKHIPYMKGQSKAEAASKYMSSKHGKTVARLSSKKTNKTENKKEDISYTSEIKKQEIIDKYNISEGESASIKDYTSDGYLSINKELKDNYGDISKCSREVEDKCKNIDSTLDKLPKYEGTVVRREPDYMSAKYKEGRTYTNDFYTSTTAWSDVGGVTQLYIKQSSGCNISKLSTSPGENEVLLPRGFTYKITKIEKTSSGYTKVYAEEVKQ